MKRLLVLGGSPFQVPAIVQALKQGIYVITCDYLPDNPGHNFSHEYHNISTTDKEAVLALAHERNVDGVLAYASDPAATTAAYVTGKLNLPGNPYASVECLVHKNHFRTFLERNGFNTPRHISVDSFTQAIVNSKRLQYPLIVKPADSSGSKGVSRVDIPDELPRAFQDALNFSRCGRVVIEEFVQRKGRQIAGDGFLKDGKLVFTSFGDEHFDENCSPYAPVGESFPGELSDHNLEILEHELQRLLTLLRMDTLVFNVDAIFDGDGNLYILEVGPRSGGNCLPEIIKLYSTCDLIDLALRASLGLPITSSQYASSPTGYLSSWIVHSNTVGKFAGVRVDPGLKDRLIKLDIFAKPGDPVYRFQGSHHALGCALLTFQSRQEMTEMLKNMSFYLQPLME